MFYIGMFFLVTLLVSLLITYSIDFAFQRWGMRGLIVAVILDILLALTAVRLTSPPSSEGPYWPIITTVLVTVLLATLLACTDRIQQLAGLPRVVITAAIVWVLGTCLLISLELIAYFTGQITPGAHYPPPFFP